MKVQSTELVVKPIEVLSDKVYIRTNIVRIDKHDIEEGVSFNGWEYDEVEMPLNDYLSAIEVMGQQVTNIMLEVL